MNKSAYFEQLSEAYSAEIDDLFSDSEGRNVLNARLRDKRNELDALLQMLEYAPEMVLPVFHQAFQFGKSGGMARAACSEPDDDDFPSWSSLSDAITLETWATPLVTKVLAAKGGETFLVSAAVCEFLRQFDGGSRAEDAPSDASPNEEDDLEEADRFTDLGEAGADWLGEQGFDSHNA